MGQIVRFAALWKSFLLLELLVSLCPVPKGASWVFSWWTGCVCLGRTCCN